MVSDRRSSAVYRLVSRCLIALMLLQLALPSWAAFGAASQAGWIEICATGGIRWVKLAEPDTKVADHQVAYDHCVLCAATGATPDFDAAHYLVLQSGRWPINFFGTCAPSSFAGHAILSRAPPFVRLS